MKNKIQIFRLRSILLSSLILIFLLSNSLGVIAQDPLLIDPAGNATFSGNVGIGTLDPMAPLHVSGDLILGNDKKGERFILHTRPATQGDFMQIACDLPNGNWDWSNGILLNRNGNVGIGTYNRENYKLNVNGSLFASTAIFNGNVGIGKNPDYKLDVNGNGDYTVEFNVNGRMRSGGSAGGLWLDDSNKKFIGAIDENRIGLWNVGWGLIVNSDGNVGIGKEAPSYPLHVASSSNGTFANGMGYLLAQNAIPVSGNNPISIYAERYIMAWGFIAWSDTRIKNIRGISDSQKDLQTIMDIEITDYTFIDTIEKGNKQNKKVIAQQLVEVYPQAVSNNITETVPDIYQKAEINDGWIELETDLQVGERVKLITEISTEVYEVLQAEPTRFKVKFESEKLETVPVFVYGREVNDFHTVDYDAISMLNVSATQELARRIKQLEKEKAVLQNDLNNFKDRLLKIEASLQQ